MYVATIAIVRRTSVRAGVFSRDVAHAISEIIQRHFRSGNIPCLSVPRDGRHWFARH